MDQYDGNQARKTDQFGHPAVNHGAVAGGMGPYGTETGTGGVHGTTGYDQTAAAGHGAQQGHGHGTGGMGTGTTGLGGTGAAAYGADTGGHGQQQQHTGGILHRSGSSGSSSSEDDGQGGRRKKGIKEKIKEKLPGGHKDEQHQGGQAYTTTNTGTTGQHYGTGTQQHQEPEKKGIMEKIKDKIPGSHNN